MQCARKQPVKRPVTWRSAYVCALLSEMLSAMYQSAVLLTALLLASSGAALVRGLRQDDVLGSNARGLYDRDDRFQTESMTPDQLQGEEENCAHAMMHVHVERATILFPLAKHIVTLDTMHHAGIEVELAGLLWNHTYVLSLHATDHQGNMASLLEFHIIDSSSSWPFSVPPIERHGTPSSTGVTFNMKPHVREPGDHVFHIHLRRNYNVNCHTLVHSQSLEFRAASEADRVLWRDSMPEHRTEAILIGWPPDRDTIPTRSLKTSGLRAKLLGMLNVSYILQVTWGDAEYVDIGIKTQETFAMIKAPVDFFGSGEVVFTVRLYMFKGNDIQARTGEVLQQDDEEFVLVAEANKVVYVLDDEDAPAPDYNLHVHDVGYNQQLNSEWAIGPNTGRNHSEIAEENEANMRLGNGNVGRKGSGSAFDQSSESNAHVFTWLHDPVWCASTPHTNATCTYGGHRIDGLTQDRVEPQAVCRTLADAGIRSILVHGDSYARHIKVALCVAITGDYVYANILDEHDAEIRHKCSGRWQFAERSHACRKSMTGCCNGCGGRVQVCVCFLRL
jgi:hypothetical protein